MKIRSCKRMGRSRIARCGLPVFKLSELSITPATVKAGKNPSRQMEINAPPALSVTFKTSTVLYKGDTIKLTIYRTSGEPVGHPMHLARDPFFLYPVVQLYTSTSGDAVGFNIMNPRNRNTSIAAGGSSTGNFGFKRVRIVIGRDPFQSVFKQEKYKRFLYMKTLNQRIPGRITEGPGLDPASSFYGYLGANGPAPHYSLWQFEVPSSALPNDGLPSTRLRFAKFRTFTHQPDSETAITFVVDQEFIKKDTNIYILMGPDPDNGIIKPNGSPGTVYKWGLNVSRHKVEENMHAWTTTV